MRGCRVRSRTFLMSEIFCQGILFSRIFDSLQPTRTREQNIRGFSALRTVLRQLCYALYESTYLRIAETTFPLQPQGKRTDALCQRQGDISPWGREHFGFFWHSRRFCSCGRGFWVCGTRLIKRGYLELRRRRAGRKLRFLGSDVIVTDGDLTKF
jgi:hypothetical protein